MVFVAFERQGEANLAGFCRSLPCKRWLVDHKRSIASRAGSHKAHQGMPIADVMTPLIHQVPHQRQRAPKGPLCCAMRLNYFNALKRTRLGLAPSSPRRFFLSASYSW